MVQLSSSTTHKSSIFMGVVNLGSKKSEKSAEDTTKAKVNDFGMKQRSIWGSETKQFEPHNNLGAPIALFDG
ncbi:unnamed protein product [Arabidopsis halleri]